jgi:hypothetical protein
VASRRATNPVGWLFLGGAVHVLAGEYAVYGIITSPGARPLQHAVAWLSSVTFAIGPVIDFILIPLYCPDGRLVPRRWASLRGSPSGELLSVVRETMQPQHASVWSRPSSGGGGSPSESNGVGGRRDRRAFYHSTSFQISGCNSSLSPISAKSSTARLRCAIDSCSRPAA